MIQKDKTQLSRLAFIDRRIREGMRSGLLANCKTIAREYEVSAKSIQRDIEYLKNDRDAPIAYDQKRKGYYYSEENYALPAIPISTSDLFAICLAEKVLRQHENTPVYTKLRKVFQRIAESLPGQLSIHPSWVDRRISIIQEYRTQIKPEIWEAVANALQQNRTLAIAYRKPGAAEALPRPVDPYHATSFQGEWYMIGYCHLRGEVRTFAISRIQQAALQPQSFQAPATFDFEALLNQRFGIFGGDRHYQVEIQFSAKLAPYIMERIWHPNQNLERQADGRVILKLTTDHLQEIKQWLLSWGSGATALAPPELVLQVRAELEQARANYS